MGNAQNDKVDVLIWHSPAEGKIVGQNLSVERGTTVAQALESLGIEKSASVSVGIWGKPCELGQNLLGGERIELYRPLRVDPKVARRLRFNNKAANNNK